MIRYSESNYSLFMSFSPFNGFFTWSLSPSDYKSANNSIIKYTFYPDDMLELKKLFMQAYNNMNHKQNFKYEKIFKYPKIPTQTKVALIYQNGNFGMMIVITNGNVTYTFKTQKIHCFLCLYEFIKNWIIGIALFDIVKSGAGKNTNNYQNQKNDIFEEIDNENNISVDNADEIVSETMNLINNDDSSASLGNGNGKAGDAKPISVNNKNNDVENGVVDFNEYYNNL